MASLSQRDAVILWVIIAAVAGGVLWFVGGQPLYNSWVEKQELVDEATREYEKNIKILDDAPKTEAEYARIQAAIPKEAADERSASRGFSEDVNAVAQKVLGGVPVVGRVDQEPMKEKEAENFSLLKVPVSATGKLEDVAKLLKTFDEKGYLLRKVAIQQRSLDSPDLRLELEIGRIVQIEVPQQRRARPRGGSTTLK